jgi:hypothetical protein
MADDDAFTIRVRAGTQVVPLALLAGAAVLLIALAITGPGYTRSDARGGGPAIAIGLAVAILAIGSLFARRILDPERRSTVIDAEGVRAGTGARTLRWAEIEHVGYAIDGRNIWVARSPGAAGADGILVDATNTDRDAAEILAAIERFSRAAGRELELPTRPPARA